MSGLRERKKLATWRAIRSHALRLFDERGYDAVSVDQVAEAAGVSRSTVFNYFASKEAIVFDEDPQERDAWRSLMAERPDDEPLWDSLVAVLLGVAGRRAPTLPLLRRLKADSPTLAQYSRDLGEKSAAELRAWAVGRVAPERRAEALLCANIALAASDTAYGLWAPGEPVERYQEALATCLERAGAGLQHPG